MKKMNAMLILSLSIYGGLKSADVGLGVSYTAESGRLSANTVYIPVDVSPLFRLEGTFSYSKQTDSYSGMVDWVTRSTSVGMAPFWRKDLSDSVRLYLGSRFAYVRIASSSGDSASKYNGFEVRPVAAFEYFPVKKVSIGGEAGLSYGREHSSRDPIMLSSEKTYQISTFTSVVFRFYF